MAAQESTFDSLLSILSGPQSLNGQDPHWSLLFQCKDEAFSLTGDCPLFFSQMACLVHNNLGTNNVLELIDQSSSRLRHIIAQKTPPTRESINQCCVSIHLVGLIVKYFACSMSSKEIRDQLLLSSVWPHEQKEQNLQKMPGDAKVQTLLDEAIGALSQYPSAAWAFDIQLFSCNLLLSMCSTQLYQVDSEDIFMSYLYVAAEQQLRASLSCRDRDVAQTMPARLVRGLLLRLLEATPTPKDSSFSKPATNSAVINRNGIVDVAVREMHVLLLLFMNSPMKTIWSFLRLNEVSGSGENAPTSAPNTAITSSNSSNVQNRKSREFITPLAERCNGLLVVLLHNRRSASTTNAFRECLCLLRDDKLDDGDYADDLETHGSSSSSMLTLQRRVHLDFCELANGLSKALPSEASVLLLYSLLQAHPTFVEIMILTGKIEIILDGVLRGLYEIPHVNAPLEHMYVLIVSALMVAQDSSLRSSLSTLRSQALWYRERTLTDASFADVIVLCTLRTSIHALFKLQDQYILSNSCAVLLNIAPYITNIHVYAAERIVNVILRIASRIIKDDGSASPSAVNIGAMRETLNNLLKVVGIAIRLSKRVSNIQIIYAFIRHGSEKITSVLGHPAILSTAAAVSDTADDIKLPQLTSKIIDYLSKLEVVGDDNQGIPNFLSAAKIVELLSAAIDCEQEELDERAAIQEAQAQSLTYTYVEGDNPESFFVPCAWAACIKSCPETTWYQKSVSLFEPRFEPAATAGIGAL